MLTLAKINRYAHQHTPNGCMNDSVPKLFTIYHMTLTRSIRPDPVYYVYAVPV